MKEIITERVRKILEKEFKNFNEFTVKEGISVIPKDFIKDTVFIKDGLPLSREAFNKLYNNK